MYDHQLAAAHARNPHNLPGDAAAPTMPTLDYWAARFQAEGVEAHQRGLGCTRSPYNEHTMANDRWLGGWCHASETAVRS